MVRWHAQFVRVLAFFALCGCSYFRTNQAPRYETVQADPRHDTERAEAEHAKAIALMNGASCCKGGCDLAKAEDHLQQALIARLQQQLAANRVAVGTP